MKVKPWVVRKLMVLLLIMARNDKRLRYCRLGNHDLPAFARIARETSPASSKTSRSPFE